MKQIFNAIFVALLVGLAFACCTSDDDVIDGGVKKSLTFVATSDVSGQNVNASERMKTQLHPDQGNSVTFSADDAISVFDGVGNNKFTTTGSGASVTFKGTAAEAATYMALYPYQTAATISGSTISAVLPTTQTAQSMTYDPQAALSVATTTKEAMKFNFKNVCALVKVTTVEPLSKIVFKGNSDEKVAGAVNIAVSNAPTATGDAESIELLPASPATTIAAGTYYIAVLPQTFEHGFTLEAYKDASAPLTAYTFSKDFAITLTRSRILNIGELSQGIDANGHDYVDLGVEVTEDGKTYKVLWATMNVGASAPEEYGDYFAWGETEPKTEYSWNTYKWGTSASASAMTKYNGTDGKTVLDLEDDAAHVNWGGDWVIPTQAEYEVFYENTTSTWTANYNGTGVKGYVFTSKTDTSKSIFIPAAGWITDSPRFVGTRGFTWASGFHVYIIGGNALYFDSGEVSPYDSVVRYEGGSVRPVIRVAK